MTDADRSRPSEIPNPKFQNPNKIKAWISRFLGSALWDLRVRSLLGLEFWDLELRLRFGSLELASDLGFGTSETFPKVVL
jgi:hypothetical protein